MDGIGKNKNERKESYDYNNDKQNKKRRRWIKNGRKAKHKSIIIK